MAFVTPPPYRPPVNSPYPPSFVTTTRSSDEEIEQLAEVLLGLRSPRYHNNSPVRRIDFSDTPKKINPCEIHLSSCEMNSECSICLENDVTIETGGALSCKHTFHRSCIAKWFEMSDVHRCPYCRNAYR